MRAQGIWRKVLQIGAISALAVAVSAGAAYADTTTYSIQGHVSHTAGDWDNAAISAVPYQYNYVVTSVSAAGVPSYGWRWQSVDAEGSIVGTDGAYSIDGLAPGTYKVGFTDSNLVYQPVFYANATTVETASEVNVATGTVSGSATGIDEAVTANPDRQIMGTVHFVGAPAISGDVSADIYSLDASGTWDVAYTQPVNDDGTYNVHVATAGTYRVGFSDASSLFPDTFYDATSTVDAATDVAVVDGTPATGIDATLTAPASVRWGSTDPISSAIALSQSNFADGVGGPVVLCSADSWSAALCSTPLAHELNCPILLTHKATVDTAVVDELNRLDASEIIIIGGTSSVSVVNEMALRAAGFPVVRRLAGADAYGTSVAVAQEMVNRGLVLYDETGNLMNLAVASGSNYNDAEIGAAAAAAQDMPMLLIQKSKIPSVVASFFAANETTNTQVLAFGGTVSLSDANLAMTSPAGMDNVNRIGESTTFRTSVAAADYAINSLGWGSRSIVLASNKDAYDPIAAGPVLANIHEPLLLTAPALKLTRVSHSPKPYGYTQLTPATEVYISKQATPVIDPAGVGYISLDDTSTVLRNPNIARIDALGDITALPNDVWNYALTVAGIPH